jgi:protein-S-isoprenylcysteine O-methyltransferase Ste14
MMITVRLYAEIAIMFVVFCLALFLSAGTISWGAGWVFLFLFFAFIVVLSQWLLKHNPDLLTERLTGIGKANQLVWDKVFFVVIEVFFMAWLVLMPLDAIRFHWSYMPRWIQIAGAALLVGSFTLFFATFRENSYLSPAVRLQTERGQTVVSTGPYHYVRHPMYSAMIPFTTGTALLLGSWYGLLL